MCMDYLDTVSQASEHLSFVTLTDIRFQPIHSLCFLSSVSADNCCLVTCGLELPTSTSTTMVIIELPHLPHMFISTLTIVCLASLDRNTEWRSCGRHCDCPLDHCGCVVCGHLCPIPTDVLLR